MDALWDASVPCSVSEVLRALTASGKEISYSAVKAVLNNLHKKQILEKARLGKVTVFKPAVDRATFESNIVSSICRSLKKDFGGPVVAQLIDEFGYDEESLDRLERLIAIKRQELRRK